MAQRPAGGAEPRGGLGAAAGPCSQEARGEEPRKGPAIPGNGHLPFRLNLCKLTEVRSSRTPRRAGLARATHDKVGHYQGRRHFSGRKTDNFSPGRSLKCEKKIPSHHIMKNPQEKWDECGHALGKPVQAKKNTLWYPRTFAHPPKTSKMLLWTSHFSTPSDAQTGLWAFRKFPRDGALQKKYCPTFLSDTVSRGGVYVNAVCRLSTFWCSLPKTQWSTRTQAKPSAHVTHVFSKPIIGLFEVRHRGACGGGKELACGNRPGCVDEGEELSGIGHSSIASH